MPLALCFVAAVWQCSCAAARPPDPIVTTATTTSAPTGVVITASDERTRRTLDAWAIFLRSQNLASATEPVLQPVTATVRELPAAVGAPDATAPLRLPRLTGTEATSAEELEREALRRFIESLAVPLGIEPQFLSLVSVAKDEAAADTRTARYTQQPFAYPLRNGYGELSVTFTGDGRVVRLRSTTIAESAALRDQVNNLRASKTTADIVQSILNQSFIVKDPQGVARTLNISKVEDIRARELVLYPLLRDGGQALELRLAWELKLPDSSDGNAPQMLYFDAQTGARLDG